MIKIFTVFFLLFASVGNSQFIDFSKAQPYRSVFMETDAFDSSYLSVLEKAYTQAIPDSLKLAIGNDLAYYWHTRNLGKAYALAYKVLVLASKTKNKIVVII